MSNITTCKVLNQSNKIENEEIVLCTEWNDSKIKILILRSNNTLLMGEIFLEEFNIYAKTFNKTLKLYLNETEDILSGKNDEVEFFLDEQKFYWKRKRWALGRINVKLINELQYLKDFTLVIIDQYSKMKNSVFELKKENENLKCKSEKLINKLNEIIALKEELEKKLYTKFILIINTKKAKIRELKNKLEKLEDKHSIFDAVTDESDDELDPKNIFNSHSNLKKDYINKKSINEDINQQIGKKRRKSETIIENVISNQEKNIKFMNVHIEPILSNSNVNLNFNLREDEKTPDLLTDESECEVELKFDEDNAEDENVCNLSKITQEDSEEELF